MLKKILLSLLLLTAVLNAAEPTEEEIAKLYVATYNRAPDAGGLQYWVDTGLTLKEIAKYFFNSSETTEAYPPSSTTTYFVETVYRNLFNREPDPDGLAYWVGVIDEGIITRSVFILYAIDTDDDYDASILNNKTEVSLAYINLLGEKTNIVVENPEDYKTNPAYLASIKIFSSIIEDKETVTSVLACLEDISENADPIRDILDDICNMVNSAPIANAGANQNVTTSTTVTLNGAGSSDAENDPLAYVWRITNKPTGSSAILSDSTVITPTFTTDVEGSYTVELIVNDGTLNSAVDSTTITASADGGDNSAPLADAGPDRTAYTGEAITIHGSGTDSNGHIVKYKWTRAFDDWTVSNSADLYLYMLTKGAYTYILTVTDNAGLEASDSMVFNIINKPPEVDAGSDINTSLNQTVAIVGYAYDDYHDGGGIVSTIWTKNGQEISNELRFDYNPTTIGTDILTLTATDTDGATAIDTMRVIVTEVPPNNPPSVYAGPDKTVEVNKSITISGSAVDSDGSIISYEWKEGNTILSNSASFTYTPTSASDHILTLVVTDDDGVIASDTMTVTVIPNTLPVADAGVDQDVLTSATVVLDASGSSDSDGDELTYSWSFDSKPYRSKAQISDDTSKSPTFNTDLVGDYIVDLIVNDGLADSDISSVTINVVTPEGTADDSFGNNGIVVHSSAAGGDNNDKAFAVTLDASGNIYVAGESMNINDLTSMVIWKYKPDGTLDTTFGNRGIVVHGDDQYNWSGQCIALDTSGNIYVGGTGGPIRIGGDSEWGYVWRYKSDGTVDTSFGYYGGISKYGYPIKGIGISDGQTLYAIGSDGKVAYVWKSAEYDGHRGSRTTIITLGSDGSYTSYYANGLVLDKDDNIYIAIRAFYRRDLHCYPNGCFEFHRYAQIKKYDKHGNYIIERSYENKNGTTGAQAININKKKDKISYVIQNQSNFSVIETDLSLSTVLYSALLYGEAKATILDNANNIYITGGKSGSMAIWKLKVEDGTLDASFGNNGIVLHHNAAGGYGEDSGTSLVLNSEGEIIVTGYSENNYDDFDMVLWKYK